MRYGSFLRKEGSIGFIAPAFGCNIEPYRTAFKNALKRFNKLGYRTVEGPNVYEGRGIGISNSPRACGREFMDYYCGKEAQVLISCGGGELMCEILPWIDFDRLKMAPPKWFMGYSDNTNLTFLLPVIADTAAIYGPCAATFGMEPWHKAIGDALEVLTGRRREVTNYDGWEKESLKSQLEPLLPYNITEPFSCRCSREGEVRMSGRLLGGCLDILKNLCGTRFDKVEDFNRRYRRDGVVWFLESCDLTVLDMRRALWTLREAGWFDCARGFMVGRPYHYGEEMMGLDQYRAVTDILDVFDLPVIMDADIGHLPPMMPLISGSLAEVTLKEKTLTVRMELK